MKYLKPQSTVLLLLLHGCGYNDTKLTPTSISTGQGGAGSALNFTTMQAQLFQPHCVRCHGNSGGVSLATYSDVRAALTRIQSAVNSGAMPPSGILPTGTRNLLNQWISAGAPEVTPGDGAGGTVGGTAGGTVGGDPGGGCEDDRRLQGTSVLVEVGPNLVFDTEQEIIRNSQIDCDDR